MKKIDKLVLGSFFGPFFLTFFVVIFILLSQFMLKYVDEIVGKDLDTIVILELIFYFSIFMTPNAFPLAVLLSSLMTFGNLGQHFELTALKSAGISLIRVLVPIFVFSLVLSGVAYYSNNFIVPKANLKAFSLLYDVKQMKPSMELKEGAFYNGIDGYSIKVGKKYPDGKTLKDIIIYDHTDLKGGNKNVTMADSGQMYNMLDDQYLVLELFKGRNYSELNSGRKRFVNRQQYPDPFVRSEFESQKVVFSLASFDLTRTKEELFASNRLMKNSFDLKNDADSMKTAFTDMTEEVKEHSFKFFDFHMQDIVGIYKQRAIEREERKRQQELKKEMEEHGEMDFEQEEVDAMGRELTAAVADLEGQSDSVGNRAGRKLISDAVLETKSTPDTLSSAVKRVAVSSQNLQSEKIRKYRASKLTNDRPKNKKKAPEDSLAVQRSFSENIATIDSVLMTEKSKKNALNRSLTHVRYVKNNMTMRSGQLEKLKSELNKFQLERFKKLSYAVTILIMFFIGAPLGSIIKRGGLGIPVLISISFFIMFYIVSMISEKYTRTDFMDPFVAAWMANMILLPIGLFFMKQARNDARLFDTDFYSVFFMKMKANFFALKRKFGKTKNLN